MALPKADPSLPGGVSPIFQDTDAVRGDHMRANNNYIWENFTALAPITIASGGIESQILSIMPTASAGMKGFIFAPACTSANGLPAATEYFMTAKYDGSLLVVEARIADSHGSYFGYYNGAAWATWVQITEATGSAASVNGATLSVDAAFNDNSDVKIPSQKATRSFLELVNTYTVNAGESVTADGLVEFINGGCRTYQPTIQKGFIDDAAVLINGAVAGSNFSAVALSPTSVIAFYAGATVYGYYQMFTILGSLIIPTTPGLMNGNVVIANISAVALSATSVLTFYAGTASNYGYYQIFSIAGTAVTPGAATLINGNVVGLNMSAVALSATSVIAFYRGATAYGYYQMFSISGTAVTPGVATLMNGNVTGASFSAVALSSTSVICFYSGGASNYGYYQMFTIAGTAVTPGLATLMNGNVAGSFFSAAALSPTFVIVCYAGVSNYGFYQLFSITGTNVAVGAVRDLNGSVAATYFSAVAISPTSVLAFYKNAAGYGAYQILTLAGSEVGAAEVSRSASTLINGNVAASYFSTVALTHTSAITFYSGASNNGYMQFITLSEQTMKNVIGTAVADAIANAPCSVNRISQIRRIRTTRALTPGAQYFAAPNGALVTASTPKATTPLVANIMVPPPNLLVGTAIDANTLLVDNIIF